MICKAIDQSLMQQSGAFYGINEKNSKKPKLNICKQNYFTSVR